MKKIYSFLAIGLMALVTFSAGAINTSDYVIDEGSTKGDVNGDGSVSGADVTSLYNVLLDNATVSGDADVNGDGIVNGADVTALYTILLDGTTTTGGSVIEMSDFVPNSLSSYSPSNYMHKWAEGDVIFIAVDGNDTNVYAIERVSGKWVLKDVSGNSKNGFSLDGGTVNGVYVQHATVAESQVSYISCTGDVATGAGTYTARVRDNKIAISIAMNLEHEVSRIDVNGAYSGDYFFDNVTHIDAVNSIINKSFEQTLRAPVVDIDNSTHKGYAYGVWKMNSRASGWLTLNYAKYNGYAYYVAESQKELKQGRSLSIYSPWKNAWNRDLSMRYYNHDTRESCRLNAGSTYQTVNINVGTNIIFRPWEGDNTDTQGTMTSVTSSNSGILDIAYDNTQVSVTAHKVGTTTLNIKFKSKDNTTTATYTYEVTVEPTLWIAGKKYDAENNVYKAALWRNWQDKSATLNNNNGYYNTVNRIFVRHNTTYILMGKENIDSYSDYYSCDAAIYKATNGGYFNLYKNGLSGVSKLFYQYRDFCIVTRP